MAAFTETTPRSSLATGVVTKTLSGSMWTGSRISSATGRMSPEPAYQREDGSAWLTRTTMTLLPARTLPVRSTEKAV